MRFNLVIMRYKRIVTLTCGHMLEGIVGTELEDADSSSSIGANVNAFCSSSFGSKINWWRKSGGSIPECFELRRLELCVAILFIEAESLSGASSLAGG